MGTVRVFTVDHALHEIEVADPDVFVDSFVQGFRHRDQWLRATDGVAIQVRHIARMFVWSRDRDLASVDAG